MFGNGTLWLRDLLPEKMPEARVMTFGYDASFMGSTSTGGVRGNATSLLNKLRDERDVRATC